MSRGGWGGFVSWSLDHFLYIIRNGQRVCVCVCVCVCECVCVRTCILYQACMYVCIISIVRCQVLDCSTSTVLSSTSSTEEWTSQNAGLLETTQCQ